MTQVTSLLLSRCTFLLREITPDDMTKFGCLLSGCAMLILVGCYSQQIEIKDVTNGQNYYPLATGRYWIYHVQEVTHNELAEDIYELYQIREVVTGSLSVDGAAMRLERYRRANAQQPWQLDSVFAASVNEKMGVRILQNIPLVKLQFPLEVGRQWDMHQLNILPPDEVMLTTLGEPFDLDGEIYPNTACVLLEADTANLLLRDFRVEYYAQGIGLLHKRYEQYEYINDSESEFWATDSIIGGTLVDWRLVESGVE